MKKDISLSLEEIKLYNEFCHIRETLGEWRLPIVGMNTEPDPIENGVENTSENASGPGSETP